MKGSKNVRVSNGVSVLDTGSRGSRGVFATADARRVLAEELPQVIYQGRAASRVSRASPSVGTTSPLSVGLVPSLAVRPVVQPQSASLRLDPPPSACKARPASNRKSSGVSRSFVPWCARK